MILFLGLLSMLVLLSVSLPLDFITRASVPFTMTRTIEQLQDPHRMMKWILPYADQDSGSVKAFKAGRPGIRYKTDSVVLMTAKPESATLAFTRDGKEKQYDFLVTRDRRDTRRCNVTLTITTTLWKRLIDRDPIDVEVIKSMGNLSRYVNDTRLFYGYAIREGRVKDSILISLTTAVPVTDEYLRSGKLFDSLIRFTQLKSLRYNGNRYFHRQYLEHDSVQITASIGVKSLFEPEPGDGLNKKFLPFGEKQLEIEYRGPYQDVTGAYKALENYKRDHAIINSGLPLELYSSPGFGFDSSDTVSLMLCLPFTEN
ncbi:hypothetical protein [Flavihumibacter petaseus]|uniref:hypothetical protein n=1 Tax=Flavihumibacter petaseus TaxID=549295 RepID=UPI0012FCEA3F|nr:hypothetical protein [Flavihumibacter petaseus]